MKIKILVISLIIGISIVILFITKPSLNTHRAFIKEKTLSNLEKTTIQNNFPKYDELKQKFTWDYFPIFSEKNYYLFSTGATPIEGKFETVTLGIAGFIIPLNNFDINKSYNKSNFEINITSNKSEYSQLEPIWLTIQIKNISPNADSLDLYNDMDFLNCSIVTNMYGKRLKYRPFALIERGPNFIKFENNEQKTFYVELSDGYGENILGGGNRILFKPRSYFSEGKYSVVQNIINRETKERFYSNKIEFLVKFPENNDLNIFNRLIEIDKNYDVKKSMWNNYIEDLKNFYYKNKNNNYSDEIFYNYLRTILYVQAFPEDKGFKNFFSDGFIDECKAFIDENPDSYYCEKIIEDLLPCYVTGLNKTKLEAYYFLKDLMGGHPDTKIESAVLKYLGNEKYINHFFRKRKNKK
jgi:hypothetical protein